jgi:putative PEP-CTERM system TPR-repeat lipoprotein
MARRHRHKSRHFLRTHLPKILAGLAGVAVLVGGAYIATRKSPEDHLKAGVAMQQHGDLKGAAIELKNALQGAPDNADARYLLGKVHFANGEYLPAEKELKKARELGNKDASLEPLFARTLLALNQPQRVLDEIKQDEARPAESNAAILALRARAHVMLKDNAAAEKYLSDAQGLFPDHPETLASRAFLALSKNQLDEALTFTDQAIAKANQRADLWVMKGDLLRLAKRNDEALTAYGKALASEPANIPARLASAQLHLEANVLDKAEADLKELNKYAPSNVMGRYLGAFIEFRRARYPEANTKLQDVLKTAPGFMPAQLLAGAVNLAMGNREGAKSHLAKVLDAAPQHPLARKLMAATLADLGELTQAKTILGSFDSAASDPMLNTLRGELALRQGEFAEARKHLEKMGETAPQSAKYFTELAASRMGSGDEAGAIQALTKAAELDTATAKPDVLLVLTYLKDKRYEDALKVVDKLEKERPTDPLIQNLRGTIHISRDDKVQARASFTKALQIQPSYFPAASNLALLDMMDKDIKSARSRFEQLLKQAPTESRAWLALAALDARDKNEAGYLKNLEQARKTNSNNAQAHQLLIRYWLDKKDAGKALSAANEALTATGRPEFQEFIGLAQLMQKDNANALGTFSRWAEISPTNPMAHFRLAQAQIAAKNNDAALKSLDKTLALRADFVDASVNKALLLGRMGRSNEGIKIARTLQASAPKAAAGYLAEAEVLLADKKYLDAAKLFAKSAQIVGQGQPLARAYQAYAAAGQSAEGEKLLDQWLNIHPNDAFVRHHLALVQLNTKRLKESAENYRFLIRANPRDLVANNNFAWLLGEMKDPEAVKAAESAYKLDPDNPATLDTLGQILINVGQTNRGLDMLKKAFAKAPNSSEIHWHMAAGMAKAGDRKNALANLELLLGHEREFPQKQEAINLFNMLKQSPK